MPWPVSQYMTTVIRTSVQPSQPPQATGIAAATARNGTTISAPSTICSLRDWVSPPSVALTCSRSGSAVRTAVAVGGVMDETSFTGHRGATYATVTYATVSS